MKAKLTIAISLVLLIASAYAADLKIATYNIRNFKSGRSLKTTDLDRLKQIIEKTDADFIGVQEIVDHQGFKEFIEFALPEYKVIVEQCGGSGRQNLGFIYRKSVFTLEQISLDLDISLSNSCKKGLRPALLGDFYWKQGKKKIRVIGLHLKAGADLDDKARRYQQFSVLGKKINEYYSQGMKNIVVMGDLNTTDYILKDEFYQKFISFLKKAKLKDYARDVECTSYYRKYKNQSARYSSRLDHVLVSKNLAGNHAYLDSESMTHCGYNQCEPADLVDLGPSYSYVSDHCPVVSTLEN